MKGFLNENVLKTIVNSDWSLMPETHNYKENRADMYTLVHSSGTLALLLFADLLNLALPELTPNYDETMEVVNVSGNEWLMQEVEKEDNKEIHFLGVDETGTLCIATFVSDDYYTNSLEIAKLLENIEFLSKKENFVKYDLNFPTTN